MNRESFMDSVGSREATVIVCSQCCEVFSSAVEHGGHKCEASARQRQVTGTQTGTSSHLLFCKTCDLSFTDKCLYQDHVTVCRRRKKDRIYTCGMCDKYFFKACVLQAHMKIHYASKEFVCDVCSKAFLHKHQLTTHKTCHSEVRPYKCTQCELGFKRSQHLQRHQLVHSGEKSFACEKCDYRSTSMYAVMRHRMSVHTLERPFACSFCSNSFTEKCKLDTHIKRVHKNSQNAKTSSNHRRLMIPCLFCDKQFFWRKHLTSHMQFDHREEFDNLSKENDKIIKIEMDIDIDPEYDLNVDPSALPKEVFKRKYSLAPRHNCLFCVQTFCKKVNLSKHMKTMHKNEDSSKCSKEITEKSQHKNTSKTSPGINCRRSKRRKCRVDVDSDPDYVPTTLLRPKRHSHVNKKQDFIY